MYKKILFVFMVLMIMANAKQYLVKSSEAISIPKIINYQGKLTNLTGSAVNDSTYSITFRLYTSSSGGSSFWSETHNVQTNAGIFNVLLGLSIPIESIPQSGNCYLEMQVNPHPAMTPRIRLVSSAYAYLAKKSDTANFALSANIAYVDSTRIATNAHKLQGKDTVALSNKFVDEGETNAITNIMIVDNAVTSSKIQDGTIQLVDLAFTPATRPLTPPVSNTEIQDNAITSSKIQDNAVVSAKIQDNAIISSKIQDGTILRQDVATTFKAPYADTSDYVRNVNIQYVDSARVSTNAHKLQGKDTIALSAKFVDEGQINAITNTMISGNAITTDKIQDGTITRNDVSLTFKAPLADTADYARVIPGAIDSARVAATAYNSYKLQGKDTIALSAKFVDEGQPNSISSAMIIDGAITNADISNSAGISDTKLSGSGSLITNFNADLLDGQHASAFTSVASDFGRSGVATDLYEGTTTLTDKYVNEGQANSIKSAMFALPCTLQGSVATGGAILRINNSGTGNGITVNNAGQSGLVIGRAGKNGVNIDSVADVGVYVNRCDTGLSVLRARHNGINIDSAGAYGVYVDSSNSNGFYVNRAGWNGLAIGSAAQIGVYVGSTGQYGIYIDSSVSHGVNIKKSLGQGVRISRASSNGLAVDSAAIGLAIIQTGSDGVNVYRAGNFGFRVYRAASQAFSVDSALYGLAVGTAADDGVNINRARDNGVFIDSVADVGFSVNRCDTGLSVLRARHNGINIDSAGANGVFVDSSNFDGFFVNRAGRFGVSVGSAAQAGVWVDSAGSYGVLAYGNVVGGYFRAANPGAEGIQVSSYNNIASDTAIMAWGKGVATGGWGTSLADGEAPCIVSPNMTMICYGNATLSNGTVKIDYPKMFKNNIRPDVPVTINLTPIGNPSGMLCVSELKSSGFSVILKQIPGWSGDNNVSFSWSAYGTMKELVDSPEEQAEYKRMEAELRSRRLVSAHQEIRINSEP